MTTASDFRLFLVDVLPQGSGLISPCTEDGTPLQRAGQFAASFQAAQVAEAEHDALVRIRFGPPAGRQPPPGSTFTTYTTDPWAQLSDGSWVAPDLRADGTQIGWLRIVPRSVTVSPQEA